MRRPRTSFANPIHDTGETPGLVEKLKAESDACLAESRFPAAIATNRRLLAILDGMDDPRTQAVAEIALGTALVACGKPREAIPSFSRARALLCAHGLPGDFALAYFNLGMDFACMNKLSLAKAAFRRSATLYRELGQRKDLRQCQVLLAHTLSLLGELEAARGMLAEVNQDLDLLDAFDRMALHRTEAAVDLGQGRYAEAEEAFGRCYRSGCELDDPRIKADSLYNLAMLKRRLEDRWAMRAFLVEAQACIAGLGCWEAESRIQGLLQASQANPKPASLKRLTESQPLRRCS